MSAPGYQICSNCVMDTTRLEDHLRAGRRLRSLHDVLSRRAAELGHGTSRAERSSTQLAAEIKATRRRTRLRLHHRRQRRHRQLVPDLHREGAARTCGRWCSTSMPAGTRRSPSTTSRSSSTVCGLDLYTEVIDWEEMRDLQLAFFKSGVPHIDTPQDHAFFATMYNFAEQHTAFGTS